MISGIIKVSVSNLQLSLRTPTWTLIIMDITKPHPIIVYKQNPPPLQSYITENKKISLILW